MAEHLPGADQWTSKGDPAWRDKIRCRLHLKTLTGKCGPTQNELLTVHNIAIQHRRQQHRLIRRQHPQTKKTTRRTANAIGKVQRPASARCYRTDRNPLRVSQVVLVFDLIE